MVIYVYGTHHTSIIQCQGIQLSIVFPEHARAKSKKHVDYNNIKAEKEPSMS